MEATWLLGGQCIVQEGAGGGYISQLVLVFRFSHCRLSDSLRNETHEERLGDGVDKDETDETCISPCGCR
ncbi:uncharacterized [Tachysurus ichikawai]